MPGGRPTKLTPETQLAYTTLLAAGVGRRAAATQLGLGHRTVAAWRSSSDEFREACEDAEASANAGPTRALYEAANRGEPWAVKLWLTNRDSGNWREKVDVDVKTETTLNINAPALSDILALEAALESRRTALELDPVSAEVDGGAVLDVDSWEPGEDK